MAFGLQGRREEDNSRLSGEWSAYDSITSIRKTPFQRGAHPGNVCGTGEPIAITKRQGGNGHTLEPSAKVVGMSSGGGLCPTALIPLSNDEGSGRVE
jgi:hypothetical protein